MIASLGVMDSLLHSTVPVKQILDGSCAASLGNYILK
jgi:hypothetical protein